MEILNRESSLFMQVQYLWIPVFTGMTTFCETIILVVEDNEQNMVLMTQLLSHYGYEVLEASEGATALSMMRAHMPDLVLLDLQMPVMDGFDVIGKIRVEPRLKKMKVVAVTSFAMKGDREKAMAAGFDEYVTKPVDTRALPALIEKILSGERW